MRHTGIISPCQTCGQTKIIRGRAGGKWSCSACWYRWVYHNRPARRAKIRAAQARYIAKNRERLNALNKERQRQHPEYGQRAYAKLKARLKADPSLREAMNRRAAEYQRKRYHSDAEFRARCSAKARRAYLKRKGLDKVSDL